MSTILIKNASIAAVEGAKGDRSILIKNGAVDSVLLNSDDFDVAEIVDLKGATIFHGFIDVHCHGAVGVDVNEADRDGLIEIGGFLARRGVTAWMPTLVPDSEEHYRRTIAEIDRVMAIQGDMPVAQIVGVHYEGAFANAKMCGALRPEFFKKFTGGEVSELPRLKAGVHMTTFAPEIDGGIELTRELVCQGWVASIGHTNADVNTLEAAFAAGARHITHFFNAMSGIHHRDVGVAGWALSNPGVTFDIIADGIHVEPKMLEFAIRSKSSDGVSLISDSISPTGRGDGHFELWGETITVEKGRTRNERGSIAGSVITLLDAVQMMRKIGFSDSDISQMASLNPAKLLGLENLYGSIEVGKRADIVGLDENGNVELVMIGGMIADKIEY